MYARPTYMHTCVAGANESSNEITPEFIGRWFIPQNHIIIYAGTTTWPDVLQPLHSTH